MAANASSPTIIFKQRPGCIAIGWSGEICRIDDSSVVKHPKFFPGHPTYNEQYRDLITLERIIYERLGDHKGIIEYLGIADMKTGAVRLAYAKQGDLSTYIQSHDMPSQSFRDRWIQLLMETFYHIYCCKVLHQDIKLNNILVDNDCLKVIDFANGALLPLDADMEATCADDPLSRVDLLCLGCVIYSIATWQAFIYDYFEKDRWPMPEELPPTSDIPCGDIIKKCWEDKYSTIASLYEDIIAWLGQRR
jgi:serine/threonine protein kinase